MKILELQERYGEDIVDHMYDVLLVGNVYELATDVLELTPLEQLDKWADEIGEIYSERACNE